ncbi:MAG: Na/Pi cotransporter family protein [Methylococcales bacterium]|nr:Na/Pi cotransporter family protein [Methylococcales bacterium]
MIRNSLLFIVMLLLSYGFWISSDFKTIIAGISIFLFGMLSLQQGFRSFTGGILEKVLKVITSSLPKRLCFGVITTMIMQSSSLLSVLVISFISAGLLDLAAGIGIIFGANLGTTTGAWLVAGFGIKVNISAYAMPMLVFGVLLVLQKSKNLKGLGYILTGIGFLFLGIHYMKEGFEAFRGTIQLTDYALTGFLGLLVFVVLGVITTIIIQSSDATMVLIITALASSQVTYENSLALAVGANIGTTVTAVLGALSANIKGKRLAGAHLIFNLFTAIVAIVLMDQFIWVVDRFCVLVGIAADDYTLKLAAFHTLFNVVGISVMLPLVQPLARLLERLLVDTTGALDKPRFLTQSALQFPETAVEAVRNETEHLYGNTVHIILKTMGLHRRDVFSEQDLGDIIKKYQKLPDYDLDDAYERNFKGIYSAIVEFISKARFSWELKQSGQLYWLRGANLKLAEAIKATKHLQKNLQKSHASHNVYLKQEYDKIRYQIATLLRDIEEIKTQKLVSELPLLSQDMLKVKLKDQNIVMMENIEVLIREHKISSQMGTSLMNDSAYVYDIQSNLISMATIVFINYAIQSIDAEREMTLTDSELLNVVNSAAKTE